MNLQHSKPSFWDVVKSVIAAMFGVQSDKARERDFSAGNLWAYIIVGIVMVTLFVLAVILVVNLVLSNVS